MRNIRSFIIISCILLSLTTHLAAFQFEPITQDFTAFGTGTRQSFLIRNNQSSPVAIKIRMVHREMSENGVEMLTDASSLFFVYPTQVLVPPNGMQTIRVQWLGEPEVKKELPFRIIAEQLPIQMTPGGSGVSILITYQGSVYILPDEIRFGVDLVSIERDDTPPLESNSDNKKRLSVRLENTGNSHMLLTNPVLTVESRGFGGVVLSRVQLTSEELVGLAGENILAGNQRVFSIPWPVGLKDGELNATFTVEPTR